MTWSPSRVVITGGAGFLGSHLADRLIADDAEVICVDNLITGSERNVRHLAEHPGFSFRAEDITGTWNVDGDVDAILHFASLASPVDYQRHPLETLEVGTTGTMNALRIAEDKGARFLLASTSEVYGDPLVHPQPESYWGNVNPIGPRGVYDEAKRYAEALTMAYHRQQGVDTAIIRIFIFRFAGITHRECRHRRCCTIVGYIADDGVARPAAGTVRKRVSVATVHRVAKVAPAGVARARIGRDQCECACFFPAMKDGKASSAASIAEGWLLCAMTCTRPPANSTADCTSR